MKRLLILVLGIVSLIASLAVCARLTGTDYIIVDTGQVICYDDSDEMACPMAGTSFYGQDPQYNGAQPDYTDNGNGTITDNNTGLIWQKSAGVKMTWSEAVAGADTFSLAGYDDWRCPTIKELYSLIMFSGIDPSGWSGTDPSQLTPFIDTDYFEFEYGDPNDGDRIIDAQYWSSTEYVSTTMGGDATAFGVNFADGRIKGYPSEPVGPPGQEFTKTSFVKYVRGRTDYGINEFVDNGDGTITDAASGLMWQQADDGMGRTWEEALAYAESLTFAGHDDWRLPNVKELQSIVDYTRSPATTASPAIDPLFTCSAITDEGGGTNYPFYWASTTHESWSAPSGEWGCYVAFGEALGWMQEPFPPYSYVLQDVHGAGAQRSDPKSGNPGDYPYGHGPQGDVVRVYNHVRCVRDVDVTSGQITPDRTEYGASLRQNYPNPFNPTTNIKYSIQEFGHVSMKIFDAQGRLVKTLVYDEQNPENGEHSVKWDGRNHKGELVSSGVYFCRLSNGDYAKTIKMTLLK